MEKASRQLDMEVIEKQKCLDSLEYLLRYKGKAAALDLISAMEQRLIATASISPTRVNTPYVNTIAPEDEPEYPGDHDLEKKIRSAIRWNAMAMVVKANREREGIGGHISTYASLAMLYEVGFQHFFKGHNNPNGADMIYFQGHASPGNYARAYLEGRLSEKKLHAFRQELADGGGLSSYPHPYLMPDFWQFPTVSMGLGPIMSIYQAKFNRYMKSRGFIGNREPHVWCYIGDGETDEPETLGALQLAAREHLDNLTFVVNCNLQRLDGPVRGNGKIIQDLEGVFRGAGWNVIKVIWGSEWDPIINGPHREKIVNALNAVLDGQMQKFSVCSGAYLRKHFFGSDPDLFTAVSHLTDAQLERLARGGHDPKKVYAAYHAALNHKGQPTVILAHTVKGYGLGEAGEGKNISHQQKKMNEKELREFRTRFNIPISDDEIADTPFYKPDKNSPEMKYYLEQRKKLGGYLPERRTDAQVLNVPGPDFYAEFLLGSDGRQASTTMAFVRILTKLLRDKEVGSHVVPIIPDEARTFGMEALFRQVGIYSSKGQLYEPQDSESLLYYREEKDGQILEEGINEAGAMSSFISAGTAYSSHGVNMIPFFIYYSMFGFQRVGDLIWLAGDIRSKGFLMGGTAGRTTLNGEGLQHQDGHSLLIASTIPTIMAYDVAYAFEIAVILQDGIKRMYAQNEELFYYIVLGNENYEMPAMPKGAEEGIINGLYRFEKSKDKATGKNKVHLLGSGAIMNEVRKAKKILEADYGFSVDVWGATNYKRLRAETIQAERWNMLHPGKKAQKSYLQETLDNEDGLFVAASDNVRLVPDQIAPWVPGGLFTLGTDGFGRSETREALRRFFEVDAEMIVLGTLYHASQNGWLKPDVLKSAIKKLKVDPEKSHPEFY